jgi:hypothetical protein
MFPLAEDYKTVHDLVSLSKPTRIPANSRLENEKKRFEITARLVGYRLEADNDFHVVIRDLNNYNETMVVGIPSTECATECKMRPVYRDEFNRARAFIVDLIGPSPVGKFKTPSSPIVVQVMGVGFFDPASDIPERAQNGIELHPVRSIIVIDSAR